MALSTTQALDCFRSTDLIGLGMEADAIRRSLHLDNVVTYAAELEGMPSPTTAELLAAAAASGKSLRETLQRHMAEGLESLSDGDGRSVVAVGSETASLDAYLDIHRTAHQLGLFTTAAMVFGCGETLDQRAAHIEAIGRLQQETGGLLSFAPIAYHPTSLAGLPPDWEEATAVEYLKTLSITRLALDSVPSLVADCRHQPLKVVQMALRFGADDAGEIGASSPAPDQRCAPSEEDLRRIIRDSGLRPVQRDRTYRICYLSS